MAVLPTETGVLDGVDLEGVSNKSTALSLLLPSGFLAAGEGVRQEEEGGEAEQMPWLSVSLLVNTYVQKFERERRGRANGGGCNKNQIS